MKKRFSLLIIGLYILAQAMSLPKVGMTWDEPSSFFFGRTALRFFLTGDRGYVTESEYNNPKRFGKDPFQYIFGEDVYPPFPFIVASATSYVFAEHLHIMSPITAHHTGLVFLGGLGVLAMYGIGLTLGWSGVVALGIALLYGTYPTIVGQMRNDAKDVPLMSMLVVFVFFALRWLLSLKKGGKQNIFYGIGAGITLGLAQASKPTAALIVPIFAIFFLITFIFFPAFRKKIGSLPKLIPPVIFIGLLAVFIFFLSWPWLWNDPVGKLTQVLTFFKVVGRGMPTLYLGTVYQAGINLPWHYPLGILALQTPISVLIIGIISILSIIFITVRKKDPMPLFFLLWVLIGMGRFFVPGVLIYAKVRHFIDVMPAFFLVIGVVLNEISRLEIRGSRKAIPIPFFLTRISKLEPRTVTLRQVITYGIFFFMVGEQLMVIATHFPYEPSYFNAFIGGTKNVAEKKLFDIEYWASAVKDGMNYISKKADLDHPATVYACTMAHLALFYETPGVTVTSNPSATYTLVPNSASWFGAVESFEQDHHDLVYTVKRGGGDLLWVYKSKSYAAWNCGQETGMVYKRP